MKTLRAILSFILATFWSIVLFFICRKSNPKQNAETKKEEIKNELEKKSADEIAADSPNSNTISTNIELEQDELRKRIRDRLNKNIQRTGSE